MRQTLRIVISPIIGFLGSIVFIRLLRSGHTNTIIVFTVVVIITTIIYLAYNYWKIHKILQELKRLKTGNK